MWNLMRTNVCKLGNVLWKEVMYENIRVERKLFVECCCWIKFHSATPHRWSRGNRKNLVDVFLFLFKLFRPTVMKQRYVKRQFMFNDIIQWEKKKKIIKNYSARSHILNPSATCRNVRKWRYKEKFHLFGATGLREKERERARAHRVYKEIVQTGGNWFDDNKYAYCVRLIVNDAIIKWTIERNGRQWNEM